ncbi:MAG TPA: carbonic anhydrase [Acidobacteriaceae bacterium]|nr:carbonic anhydrase [Acidobacteriaceae bacterium]
MPSGSATQPEVQVSADSQPANDGKNNPDAALSELIAGNRRFTSGRTVSHRRDLMILQQMMEKQEPFAAILSCADSRVPVEVVFDQTIGQLFVTRVAGNIVTAEILASLEYAAAVLGTHTILVMGHSRCGAVTAAIQASQPGATVPGQISALFPPIDPAVKQAGPDLEATIRANVLMQAERLRESSPLLSGLVEEGKLKIAAGYFDMGTGTVTLLDS